MKFSVAKLQEIVKQAKSEPTAEDLMKRPCCGSGCTNCPYSPKHKKGNTTVREEFKKSARIEKDPKSGKWILWTKDGKRKLGTHDSPEDAYKQEYAIEKSMEKKSAVVVPNYFTKSSAINGTEEDLKASKSPVEGIKEDRKYVTITKPLKSPLSGFTTNSKGKLATPDKRFNLINGERKLIKESANKFTKLLRGNLLSSEGISKIKQVAVLGNKEKGLAAKASQGNVIAENRQLTKQLDNFANKNTSVPASEAYRNIGARDALTRGYKGDYQSKITKLIQDDTKDALLSYNGKSIPKRIDPLKRSLIPATAEMLLRKLKGIPPWKNNKGTFRDVEFADLRRNEIHTHPNSFAGRHELAHTIKLPMMKKAPLKYGHTIFTPLHYSERLGGRKIQDMIVKNDDFLEELRAQFHATVGKGNKSKAIREATGKVKVKGLDPIRQRAEDLIAKQPHMEDNIRATLSALEHLSSNYVMPLK
jgi:hypothetical protein